MIKSTIQCCEGCVAPKRHIGCHAVCPEYISEKAAYEEIRSGAMKKKKTDEAVKDLQWHSKAKYERRIGKKVI